MNILFMFEAYMYISVVVATGEWTADDGWGPWVEKSKNKWWGHIHNIPEPPWVTLTWDQCGLQHTLLSERKKITPTCVWKNNTRVCLISQGSRGTHTHRARPAHNLLCCPKLKHTHIRTHLKYTVIYRLQLQVPEMWVSFRVTLLINH